TRCPHCHKALQVPDGAAGKAMRCPLCRQLFVLRVNVATVASVAAKEATAGISQRNGITPGSPESLNRPSFPTAFPAGASAPRRAETQCPSCKARLLPGASVCADCGYVVAEEGAEIDAEATPNLCPNPACGVANQPHDRVCRRCSSPLPTLPGTILHG